TYTVSIKDFSTLLNTTVPKANNTIAHILLYANEYQEKKPEPVNAYLKVSMIADKGLALISQAYLTGKLLIEYITGVAYISSC
ncbi:hypothetical protein, partial [Klebsiella pneumoniae]|uniref:hypothetical protein n=1 Tax=Klebsiella pneumoniae TaxID=573 RepID=UPI001952F56F